jgi:hypothetical protein
MSKSFLSNPRCRAAMARFLTEKGCIDITSPNSQNGDNICIARGINMPYEKQNQYAKSLRVKELEICSRVIASSSMGGGGDELEFGSQLAVHKDTQFNPFSRKINHLFDGV